MVYKTGIIIVTICLVCKIMGRLLPQLQPSIPTDEDEALKDTQVMVPALQDGVESLPLGKLWEAVLKNPSSMSDGVPQPGTIVSPQKDIFVNHLPEFNNLGYQLNKISFEKRRGLLLDYLVKDFMPFPENKESLKQKYSNGSQVQNMNGNTLNFTMDQDDMLFINGIQVLEVMESSPNKPPIIYVINGSLFNHTDILKPKLNLKENLNATRIDGKDFLQPSF